ncbi:protein-glutamate O-methyltransferase CheR [Acidocella sp. KAb 2-4]|uniref:CheR family methyltransferase n=1 Tax=Acidocella sp. KAb 2-4 TaxID=2885158 RepID=UPI001D07AF96|nr:protein-glutamate O-methyltransferase [Acidocella sp. KAb 2-4]MCB5945298.1 protein-glutamate O-methyltransferase [Acidocella sp. KAb 2-4]
MSTQLEARQPALVENAEFVLTARDLGVIARIMQEEAGISLSTAKANLIYSRLAKRVRKLGLPGFAEYCALVGSSEGAAERGEMIAALTTNVTRFFRELHHFDHLREHVLPPLLAQARAGKRVRLWSAACSSGQEPYSMALTVLALVPEAARYDVKILATDIDPNVLAVGEAGVYDEAALEPVPAALRRNWFTPVNGGSGRLRANDELRSLISFRKLNLIGSWPMRGRFQAIFCRNVVIYFDSGTQEALWSRMAPLLEENGALYIGHSERVSGPAEAQFANDGITAYRKRGGGVAA